MIDYSESLLKIKALEREAHDALLKKDWPEAFKLATDIKDAAEDLQRFCLEAVKS